jgi:ubiquinone/menaquinone biosynthesis C-methylase UbiE
MKHVFERKGHQSSPFLSHIAFWTIVFMHDNPLLRHFKDPFKLLRAAGLKSGQSALEVGCGPGFFTVPASKILGPEGKIYAVDVNPFAIKRIRKKEKHTGVKNIVPMCKNAACTGLPDESIDIVFLFGLPRIAGDSTKLYMEICRLLKPGGILALGKGRRARKMDTQGMEKQGFVYTGKETGVLRFEKEKK